MDPHSSVHYGGGSLTRRCFVLLVEADERLKYEAPNDWFDHYRATTLALLHQCAADVEHIVQDARDRVDEINLDV